MKIALLALGGTIASASRTPADGALPTLTARDIVGSIGNAADIADIVPVSFRQVPGAHLDIQDLLALAKDIRSRFQNGFDAAIVTQGTDTLEETAFLLDLVVPGPNTIVVTGAMRGPTVLGADGPANLAAAVRIAASSSARGLGVLVVMNDEIHSARHVQKMHTSLPSAFRSPNTGAIGWMSEDTVRLALRPRDRKTVVVDEHRSPADIGLLTIALGDDGRLIKPACDSGYHGLVVEAFGGGHVNPAFASALEKAAERIPVVIASRTGSGETLRNVYGFVGSEIDLKARGMIFSGWLNSTKARLLLSLIASPNKALADVKREFEQWRDSM